MATETVSRSQVSGEAVDRLPSGDAFTAHAGVLLGHPEGLAQVRPHRGRFAQQLPTVCGDLPMRGVEMRQHR